MKRIGIISDTHGTFDDTLREFLKDVDEIWHAGDIGSIELAGLTYTGRVGLFPAPSGTGWNSKKGRRRNPAPFL